MSATSPNRSRPVLHAIVPRNSGASFEVRRGQRIRVSGRTVIDFVAFNLHNTRERFDQARTKTNQAKLFISTGDILYSKLNSPMLTIVEDTFVEGKHDLQKGMCSRERFRLVAEGKAKRVFAEGVDLNPKAEDPERREFIERIDFVPIDPQPNGPQLFYGLRYHVHINTAEEDITFHDQVGYWLWEPATRLVIQTLSIPRGQVALATGRVAPDADRFTVRSERGSTENGICSTRFLEQAFRTDDYSIEITYNPDGSFSYITHTTLMVHGRTEPFDHTDRNTLVKVAEPRPNPWMQIIAARTNQAPMPQPV